MTRITIKKLSIVSMIFLSTFLFSCKEEPPVKSGDGIRLTNSATVTISNPSNPYDSVGITHNEAIEYLLDNRTYFGSNIDTMCLEIVDLLGDYFENENPENVGNPESYYRDSIYDFLFNKRNRSLTQLYNTYGYSSYALNLNDSILTVAGNHANYTTDINIFIEDIKTIESLLIADVTLSTNEKKWLLSQTSILRHSSALWDDVIDDLGGDTENDFDDIPEGFFDWLKGAATDTWDYIKNNPWKAIGIATVDAAVAHNGGSVWAAAGGSAITWYGLEQI